MIIQGLQRVGTCWPDMWSSSANPMILRVVIMITQHQTLKITWRGGDKSCCWYVHACISKGTSKRTGIHIMKIHSRYPLWTIYWSHLVHKLISYHVTLHIRQIIRKCNILKTRFMDKNYLLCWFSLTTGECNNNRKPNSSRKETWLWRDSWTNRHASKKSWGLSLCNWGCPTYNMSI